MKYPKFLQNFYVIATIIFVLWVLFFDSNDIFTQLERQNRLKKLAKEKEYFEKQIEVLEKNQKTMTDNPLHLEKFAREKYFFKKEKEDVYVLELDEESKKEENPKQTP